MNAGEMASRAQALRERVRAACAACGREPGSVEILPVSKFHEAAAVKGLAQAGFRRFGENYVQEGGAKAQALPELDFVLIGPLQRNKAKAALLNFREIQTVDRADLAQRLRRLAEEEGLVRPAWIQLDLWGEVTKQGGCAEADIAAIIEALGPGDGPLPCQGFLVIPPPGLAGAFARAAQVREDWRQRLGRPLRLSMGMSDDLEEAIAAGSDQVRIGTALFGERRRV